MDNDSNNNDLLAQLKQLQSYTVEDFASEEEYLAWRETFEEGLRLLTEYIEEELPGINDKE
jgi:hypothetical protein